VSPSRSVVAASALRYRWPWRPYQARVLEALKPDVGDRRLHVVAAPGAGKTTLGLEVIRLLGRPALVLAPSRTIRDQWIGRLHDFVPEGEAVASWASIDLADERFVTAITYQALHTKYRRSDLVDAEAEDESAAQHEVGPPAANDMAEVVALCRAIGVDTLVLDEAHHLRQEWWRALSAFVRALGNPTLVCLTATPPYDVASVEWRHYEELCGSIDEEISVPELVRAGTICPHQDYVWTCPPSEADIVTAHEHDRAVVAFTAELAGDSVLLDAIRQHPWVAGPSPTAEAVLDDPEFAVALMVVLRTHGIAPPKALLALLGCSAAELPPVDRRWWSVLLRHYLYDEDWPVSPEHREDLARRMRTLGLLYRRELRLLDHAGLRAALRQSSAKLDACVAVHRLERTTRGAGLRQVLLTDFIRDGEPERLGAWPLFRRLVGAVEAADATRMALVTGRLALVPNTWWAELRRVVPDVAGAPDDDLRDFVRTTDGARVADFLTRCLCEGKLDTLVGTRSLLGEGWDCPAVNSLVLASSIGSFMSINQMRGRAMRIDPLDRHKASSIWHVVAVDPSTESGLWDLVDLAERFESFAGLHATRARIESGFRRLEMGELRDAAQGLAWNAESIRRLAAYATLEARWQAAVELGAEHRMVAAVETSAARHLKRFAFANTLRYLLYTAWWTFVGNATGVLRNLHGSPQNAEQIHRIVLIMAVVGLAYSLPNLIVAARIALRHLPADGSVKQIALALLESLVDTDAIATQRTRLDLRCVAIEPGNFSVGLTGGTYYESSLFADSLATVLGPIENPRYLVSRSASGFWWRGRRDFHAVPSVLAAKQESAACFHRHWSKRLGPAELVFTRSPEGRQALLRARVRALSHEFAGRARRTDRWC